MWKFLHLYNTNALIWLILELVVLWKIQMCPSCLIWWYLHSFQLSMTCNTIHYSIQDKVIGMFLRSKNWIPVWYLICLFLFSLYIGHVDYGRSYYDVIESVEHIVENFNSNQISAPSNFKYLIALEKQVSCSFCLIVAINWYRSQIKFA